LLGRVVLLSWKFVATTVAPVQPASVVKPGAKANVPENAGAAGLIVTPTAAIVVAAAAVLAKDPLEGVTDVMV
jgi:hypothetical protein